MFREIHRSCKNLSEIKFVIKISLVNMCYVHEMKFIKIEKKSIRRSQLQAILYNACVCVIPIRNEKVSDILVYNLFIIRR